MLTLQPAGREFDPHGKRASVVIYFRELRLQRSYGGDHLWLPCG